MVPTFELEEGEGDGGEPQGPARGVGPVARGLVDAAPLDRTTPLEAAGDRLAIKSPERSFTYAELNRAANRLARQILSLRGDRAVALGRVGEQLEDELVGAPDVLRIAGEGDPAKGPLALAEERTDVLRHEAGDVEGVGDAPLLGLGADVVAVVERHRTRRL